MRPVKRTINSATVLQDRMGMSDKPINQNGFHLRQNFPNPFNNHTTISYVLAEKAQVKLTVYDVSGRKLVSLYEGKQAKGEHSIEWNSNKNNSLNAGIYFCSLKVNGAVVETIRMIKTF